MVARPLLVAGVHQPVVVYEEVTDAAIIESVREADDTEDQEERHAEEPNFQVFLDMLDTLCSFFGTHDDDVAMDHFFQCEGRALKLLHGKGWQIKDYVKRLYAEWMRSGGPEVTPAGWLTRASPAMLCWWIVEFWACIPEALVYRMFKKCSISNALDGTEDDVLWENIFDKGALEESAADDNE
ncbi:hypothetical protein HPB51_023632 [Rhipicephalus microplus]|uniref:Uncharacterized protein n=1 Tax=Rhipicephalus microplus TaxID=6941 RepID=A0A9J6DCZ1_RHIMP|nr:hypothetical protein HPB51_023632 [Rhipicephalus microplus]